MQYLIVGYGVLCLSDHVTTAGNLAYPQFNAIYNFVERVSLNLIRTSLHVPKKQIILLVKKFTSLCLKIFLIIIKKTQKKFIREILEVMLLR